MQVPKWVERFVLTGLARALCMRTRRGGAETGRHQHTTDSDSSSPESDEPYSSSNQRSTGLGLRHPRTGFLHRNFISREQQQQQLQQSTKDRDPNSAFRILGKKAKRLKCFSCRRRRRKREDPRAKRLPYEWREVTRVLDRLFFVIVAILMTSSTFLTLYAPVYAARHLDI